MIKIDYSDILQCKEVEYPCFCGTLKKIVVTNVPENIIVKQEIFSAGEGREKIIFSVERENLKVIITPQAKADTLPKCMLLKESLLLVPLNDDALLLRLRIKCSDDGINYDRLMLILDLGNTRTCALLCTTLWDPSAVQQWKNHPLSFDPLKMRVNYKSDSEVCEEAIFSSRCVLGTNVHNDWTRSFLQLDKNANISAPQVRNPDLRWQLSGPKRYFWQQDTLRVSDDYKEFTGATSELHYLRPKNSLSNHPENNNSPDYAKLSYDYELVPLDLPLVKAMSQKALKVNPEERQKAFSKGLLPYSIFLKGMIWELMEQAELQANRQRITPKPFHLSDLVVTFPAVWTTEEKEAYAKQICETANLYIQQRCFDHLHESKIDVDVSCDEGMAVFTTYLYSEYHKGLASQLIGKKVAVIDIGGGTSDLVIAEIGSEKNETLNTRYVVQAVYSNGTYEAGDKFIRNLIEKILVPSVIKKLFPSINRATYDAILEILSDVVTSSNDAIGKEALRSFVFSLWYPAALELLQLINKHKISAYNNLSLDRERQANLEEFCDIIKRHKNFDPLNMISEMTNLNEEVGNVELLLYNDELELIPPDAFKEQMAVAVENTFSATLKNFSDIVKKYDCFRVLLSGKISDIGIVRDVFRKHLGNNIMLIGMNEYEYENMPTKDYIANDSKFATVTGAGIYRMAQTGRLKGFDLKIKDPVASEFMWGLYRDQQFQSFDEIEPLAAISYDKNSIYIARKSSKEAPWIPSYELRPNPLKNIVIEKTIKIRFDAYSIIPRWLSGRFLLNGQCYELQDSQTPTEQQEVAFKEAFEFRICKLMPEENNKNHALGWLDSGMVFKHCNGGKK